MSKISRLAILSLFVAGVWIQGAGATDQAQGGLEQRLEELRQRFESRTQHSARALELRRLAHEALSTAGDVIINNDGFGGTSNQSQIVVKRQPDNGTITAWTDDRDGNLSVYGQIFDAAGMPVGENFRLHADPNVEDQFDVAIVVRPDGGFYAAYTVLRHSGDDDIQVQRYSGLGQQLGAAVNLSADPTDRLERNPAIALLANGDVLVLYERDNTGSPNSDIYGQVLVADLLFLLGDPFVVSADLIVSSNQGSPDTIRYDEREPTVAVAGNDTLWTGWTDNRDGGVRDVFAKRFWWHGSPDTVVQIGSRFKVNDEPIAANAAQNGPHIATAADGSALFAWADLRNGHWDIYKQNYDRSAMAQGANAAVNTDSTSTDQSQPQVGWADTMGLVVWTDFRSGTAQIFGQKLHADGSAAGGNDQVSGTFAVNQAEGAASYSLDGSYAVGWIQPDTANNPAALLRLFTPTDTGSTSDPVAEIVISATQIRPACATAGGGYIFSLWEEARAALPTIVGQALDPALTKLASPQLNDGPEVLHLVPTVSAGDTAGYAVWEDYRDTLQPVYSDIYLQRYTLTSGGYTPVGNNVRVIDTVESQEVRLASWNPDVASDAGGNTMAVWQDNRLQSWDIFSARYIDSIDQSTGNPVRIGINIRVDQAPVGTKQEIPRIDINATGQTVVVWEDTRDGPYAFQVWARLYTGAGATASGTEIKLELDPTHIPRSPDVAIAPDGSFGVVYEEHTQATDVNIYFQRFAATGDTIAGPIGDPILLNDDALGVQQFSPRIAAISGSYVATWQDERNGDWDIYAVRVDDGSSAPNANYLVNDPNVSDQITPAISSLRSAGAPFICWQDLRVAETAPDIFGNTNTPAIATGVGDGDIADGPRPIRFDLDQNAPNPFNPATEIRYTLSVPTRVELIVYNTLGQRVRTLVAASQDAGEHRVIWDGHDQGGRRVASGIYFYRLRWDGGEVSRKMTLLR